MADKQRRARVEEIAARVAADPQTRAGNLDGGAAAVAFIREFDARAARTPEQAEADRRARALAILAEMDRGQAGGAGNGDH